MIRPFLLALLMLCGIGLPASAHADTTVVPDQFLRRWDPVTIFYDHDVGPEQPGPTYNPQSWLAIEPDQPGAWQWLNRRTLQFRPAAPWPALSTIRITSQNQNFNLPVLLDPIAASEPESGATGLPPLSDITFTLGQPVDADVFARLLKLETRPLPALDAAAAHTLGPDDFSLTALERASESDPLRLRLHLHSPVPGGSRLLVQLALSSAPGLTAPIETLQFDTEAPFALEAAGCDSQPRVVPPGGMRIAAAAADSCRGGAGLRLQFSAALGATDPVALANLARITPTVPGLKRLADGSQIRLTGNFVPGTLYTLRIVPTALVDDRGRPLVMTGETVIPFSMPPSPPALSFRASQVMVERFGPQMLPLLGNATAAADIRIQLIQPNDRFFTHFPDVPLSVDDNTEPPAPGLEPSLDADATSAVNNQLRADAIRAMGPPPVSTLVDLPSAHASGRFGLDIAPLLAKIKPAGSPGSYLVGLRRLDASGRRDWVRVDVTDLSLSTIEEAERLHMVVTSLNSAAPVGGARITVIGEANGIRKVLFTGTTADDGSLDWQKDALPHAAPIELIVEKDGDVLRLETDNPPERYDGAAWRKPEDWLSWLGAPTPRTDIAPRALCHLFTERPIYRPEDAVEVKGYLRLLDGGHLRIPETAIGHLTLTAPDKSNQTLDLTLTPAGSFHVQLPGGRKATGDYSLAAEWKSEQQSVTCTAAFASEAYRLPDFAITLTGPDQATTDAPIAVKLAANYYAGGPVTARPLRWRVTRFPENWQPPKPPEGYVFAGDSRFAGTAGKRSSAVPVEPGVTDQTGAATLSIDPTDSDDAGPARYVVESTVTAADEQTVTQTAQILALPSVMLGMKLPRYVPDGRMISPEIIALDAKGQPVIGQEIIVTLKHRQWNAVLQASDFSDGAARYDTQVIESDITSKTVTSAADPIKLDLPVERSGVYLIEIATRDKAGRRQALTLDSFVNAGATPVTWSEPPARVFKMTADKPSHAPGETAHLVLESPWQTAEALIMVEEPKDRNSYHWLPVRNGRAVFDRLIDPADGPRLPVHALLMRGRGAEQGQDSAGLDLMRPATVASSLLLPVEPVANRVKVAVDLPAKSEPGRDIPVEIRLTDPAGNPLSGEVTLWLVDQAVLALKPEAPLDPLPAFRPAREAQLLASDSRNRITGRLPWQDSEGGDGDDGPASPFDNATVRRNFKAVAYYNPTIMVGADGVAKLTIHLPDNLTIFKMRAVAISGAERFGTATGQIAVRLPVMMQPSLPRFLRAGDSVTLSALARVVEGNGGSGKALLTVDGVDVRGPVNQTLTLDANHPVKVDFPVTVPGGRDSAKISLAVSRDADGAADAFELTLPIKPDRRPIITRRLLALNEPQTLPAPDSSVREGSFRRDLVFSARPDLLTFASGLDRLIRYPYGCLEQRVSMARAGLAAGRFNQSLLMPDAAKPDQAETLKWIERSMNDSGLVGFWPGSTASLPLSAWTLQYLTEARAAGVDVKPELIDRLAAALRAELDSLPADGIDADKAWTRLWIMLSLAQAGRGEGLDYAPLVASADRLPVEALALLIEGLAGQPDQDVAALSAAMWQRLVLRQDNGQPVYDSMPETADPDGPLLSSESRAIARVLSALERGPKPDTAQLAILRQALLRLGAGDGWGSTNADSEALLALAHDLTAPAAIAPIDVALSGGQNVHLAPETPIAPFQQTVPASLDIAAAPGVSVLAVTRMLPQALGRDAAAEQAGFVVTRRLVKVTDSGLDAQPLSLDQPGQSLQLSAGSVFEDQVTVVNPVDRRHVAIVLPLAAGTEALNPALATAPPEAKPSTAPSMAASYVAYDDDQIGYFYDNLPKGTYHFAVRVRATAAGSYSLPPAIAEAMYRPGVIGSSVGAAVIVNTGE